MFPHESTTLHGSKDLAVAPFSFLNAHPDGCPFLSKQDVSVRTSHITVDGYYPLPHSSLRKPSSDFPLTRVSSRERLLNVLYILYHKNQKKCTSCTFFDFYLILFCLCRSCRNRFYLTHTTSTGKLTFGIGHVGLLIRKNS